MAKPSAQRFTVILTEVQAHNLGLLAYETNMSKSDLLREGVEEVLKKHGYKKDKKAVLTVSKV